MLISPKLFYLLLSIGIIATLASFDPKEDNVAFIIGNPGTAQRNEIAVKNSIIYNPPEKPAIRVFRRGK